MVAIIPVNSYTQVNLIAPLSISRTTQTLRMLVDKYKASTIYIVPVNKLTGNGNIFYCTDNDQRLTSRWKPALGLARSLGTLGINLEVTPSAIGYKGNFRSNGIIPDLDFMLIHFDALLHTYETNIKVQNQPMLVFENTYSDKRQVGLCFTDITREEGREKTFQICTKDEIEPHKDVKKVHRKRILTQYKWYREMFPSATFWYG